MKRRKITKTHTPKSKVRREREPLSWKYILLTCFCGLILVVGFFGAARQHFASINYGIKNSKLKKQVEELKSEQRRLQLAREVALSPAEIKKSAKKLGFTEMTASNIQAFQAEPAANENSNKAKEPEVLKDDKKVKMVERQGTRERKQTARREVKSDK